MVVFPRAWPLGLISYRSLWELCNDLTEEFWSTMNNFGKLYHPLGDSCILHPSGNTIK